MARRASHILLDKVSNKLNVISLKDLSKNVLQRPRLQENIL